MIASGLRQLTLLAAVSAAAPAAFAVDATGWDGDARSAMRLIAGKPQAGDGGALRAGAELRLSRGWKTYWRYPGDSGVPPRFDFSRSDNVQSVVVQWPAPHRFSDGPGYSIGYRDGVVFPLRIVPKNPAQPVTLRLDLNYAICEKICVPVDAKADLTLTGDGAAQNAVIAAAEAAVPKQKVQGDPGALSIGSVRRDPADRRHVIVDVRAPESATVDLFAEGPSPDWSLPLPAAISGAAAGHRRFRFELDGLPPGAKPDGAILTLTAVAGNSAIEVKASLD